MFNLPTWTRWLGLAIAALTLTIACTQQPDSKTTPAATSPTTTSTQPLVSATNNWVGSSSHYVAVKKGLFAENGLKVEDLFFQSSSDMGTAFAAGKADIAWVTTGDAVQMAEKDPSIAIIYLIDYSNGSDGIIGRDIKSPQDLKGKTVGRENLLYERILLQAYLKKGGLTEKDLKVKDMVAADAATAFASKQVDAAVTYEPYLTKALKPGAGTVLFTTKDTNLVADAIAVHKKLIETRKPELQAYLKAVDKAVKLVQAGDAEALKIAATKMGISVAEVKEQLTGVKIFNAAENKTIAFSTTNPNSIIGNLELTTKAAAEFKITSKQIDAKSLYDASIVEAL
jgi:NitT/TauT family transport system substrate-binding protein